jgi:hypothetical protein
MSTPDKSASGKPIMWWARAMGAPLRSAFPAPDNGVSDELCELLEAADRRLDDSETRAGG